MRARGQVEVDRPERPGERRTRVVLQRGLRPCSATVTRDVDPDHRAISAYGVAADDGRSGFQTRASGRLADHRVERHGVDGVPRVRVGRLRGHIGWEKLVVAGLDRVVGRPVLHGDALQPFRAAHPGKPRHDGAQREAVLGQERGAVHRVGEQGLRCERLGEWDRGPVGMPLDRIVALEGDVQVCTGRRSRPRAAHHPTGPRSSRRYRSRRRPTDRRRPAPPPACPHGGCPRTASWRSR